MTLAARSGPIIARAYTGAPRAAGSGTIRVPMTPESGSVDQSEAVAGPIRVPARCVTVQRQFDQRARRFAGASTIVREVGQRLFERLETIRPDGRIVVDLGCAAGAQQAALLRHFAPGTWIGIDLSHAMLVQAPQGGSAFARWLPRTLAAAVARASDLRQRRLRAARERQCRLRVLQPDAELAPGAAPGLPRDCSGSARRRPVAVQQPGPGHAARAA